MTDQHTPRIPTASEIASKIVAKLFYAFLFLSASLVGLKIAIELGVPWGLGLFPLFLLAMFGCYYWSKETPPKLSRVDEVIRARETAHSCMCPKCGVANQSEYRFCPHCGAPLSDTSDSALKKG